MDEQAGPGVFFNNNNNPVLPGGGGGGGKGPPLPDGDAGEAARAQYSIPGILHFLQHEWARFEVERAQWEVERAELQVRGAGGWWWAGSGLFNPPAVVWLVFGRGGGHGSVVSVWL